MNYFYVYQNQTYYEEKSGGFLWSPKYAKGRSLHAGYETMKQVRPGDIILHSFFGHIVAISIAKSFCYSAPRPSLAFSEWSNDGWKIDAEYYILANRFPTSSHISYLYKIQPQNGPFTAALKGKQQYLCNSSKQIFDYLIEKIINYQFLQSERDKIRKFIDTKINTILLDATTPTPEPIKYIKCPKCELNYMIEGQQMCNSCQDTTN